jgi:hypothetical protein
MSEPSEPQRKYQPGDVYLVPGQKGYQVAKVLAVDPGIVHIRLYKNVFPQRPSDIDLGTLVLGSIDDPDGFGMGHVPLKYETFAAWGPQYFRRVLVREDELDGYRMWKEASGGVWE